MGETEKILYRVHDRKTTRGNIIQLSFCKQHWFFDRFIPTQYFYSFENSKIYVKAVLVKGKITEPFKLRVRRMFSEKPHLLELPNMQTLTFNFKEGDKECISTDCIEIRFPIPDIYHVGFSVFEQDEDNNPDNKLSLLSQYYWGGDKVFPLPIELREFDTIIALDYFSYQVTKLTKWLLILTGILIIQGLWPVLKKLLGGIF